MGEKIVALRLYEISSLQEILWKIVKFCIKTAAFFKVILGEVCPVFEVGC